MWKYYDNISQFGFFILYIISHFSYFISSIRFSFFFSFFSSSFSPLHVVLISISPPPPFLFFLFLPHSRMFQHLAALIHSFFSLALTLYCHVLWAFPLLNLPFISSIVQFFIVYIFFFLAAFIFSFLFSPALTLWGFFFFFWEEKCRWEGH